MWSYQIDLRKLEVRRGRIRRTPPWPLRDQETRHLHMPDLALVDFNRARLPFVLCFLAGIPRQPRRPDGRGQPLLHVEELHDHQHSGHLRTGGGRLPVQLEVSRTEVHDGDRGSELHGLLLRLHGGADVGAEHRFHLCHLLHGEHILRNAVCVHA